ncbi:MAG: hypothetical protein ACOCP8_03190 [archaeon]
MFNKEQYEARKLIDFLSEKNYEDYKHKFWDLDNIQVIIDSLYKAIIKYEKFKSSYGWDEREKGQKEIIFGGFMDKYKYKTFENKLEIKLGELKEELMLENDQTRKLVDLKIKYEN